MNDREESGDHTLAEPQQVRGPNTGQKELEIDRRYPEQALRESESRYRVLIENALTGICVQQKGRLVYLNERFAEIFGYRREELLGKRLWEIVAPEHSEMVRTRGLDRLAGKEPIRKYEINALTKTGEKKHLAVWFNLIEDRGRPGILGNIVDITDLKRAQAALIESEARFRTLFETAPDCIFMKDRSLAYTHVNPAMEELFKLPAAKLTGMTDEELFGKRVGSHLRAVDTRVLSGGSVEAEHTRSVRGTPMTFHDIRVPMRDATGEIVGLYGIARNITEWRKKADPPNRSSSADCHSVVMQSTFATARMAAEKDGMILLLGESGTGKDYLARYIHDRSPRRDGPYFAVNCAALPPELAESELFGHEAGAFTGATGRKRGLLELAEGGTLLLNEIGDLAQPLQAKLLTFLDTRSFTRVGGEKSVPVSARIIAATNRDLETDVREGRFRQDLYYRINVLSIRIPPLRERVEDIPLLVAQIIDQLAKEMQLHDAPEIDAQALATLTGYRWPGNVRELRNVLERSLMLWDEGRLELALDAGPEQRETSVLSVNFPMDRSLHDVTDEVVRSLCLEALRRSSGREAGRSSLTGDLSQLIVPLHASAWLVGRIWYTTVSKRSNMVRLPCQARGWKTYARTKRLRPGLLRTLSLKRYFLIDKLRPPSAWESAGECTTFAHQCLTGYRKKFPHVIRPKIGY
jgi:two-component system response regulator AtoC